MQVNSMSLEAKFSYCNCWFVLTGTTLNYFLDDKINNAKILFPGVGCFLIAVCLASAVHSSNADDNRAKLSCLPSDDKHRSVYVSSSVDSFDFDGIYYLMHDHLHISSISVLNF